MQFQHNELLNARNKIQQLTNQLDETSKGQEGRLEKTHQLVCALQAQRESRSATAKQAPLPLEVQILGLKKEMNHNIDFNDLLAKGMDECIRQMESKVQFYRIQSSRMEEQMMQQPPVAPSAGNTHAWKWMIETGARFIHPFIGSVHL